jgi:HAD superfamily phosphatase (TIGR01668 family)
MSFSLIPKVALPDIFGVTPALLRRKGVSLLFLDLDNTLAPYSEDLPSARVLAWMAELKAAGVTLYLISNNSDPGRVERYAEAAGIRGVAKAGKPSPETLRCVMADLRKTPAETALMGDQVFTDVLAANLAGALSILVKPLEMNALFRLRYIAEQPFRALGREKLR